MLIRSFSAIPKRVVLASLSSILSLGMVGGSGHWAVSADAVTSRLVTYQDEGKTLFALSLLSPQNAKAIAAPRVAIVVDTSASQNGDYRTDSIDIAQSIVEALPDESTVALLACDIAPVVLSKATSPKSDLLAEGFKKLELRVPLGTTDLAGAFKAAAKELGSKPDSSIIYIGDGIHLSNLISTNEFEGMIDEFREMRTSVHSLAIGPKTDCEFLATVSNHTGGKIYVRQNIVGATTQQIGNELAKVAMVPVFWPTQAAWPKEFVQTLPAKLPPIRQDRDSIVVGKLSGEKAAGKLEMTGVLAGQSVSMKWDLASEATNPDFGFLGQVVAKASANAGLLLPTPGSDALKELGLALSNSSDQLVKDARFALNSGELDSAIRIAKEALKRSPDNMSAQNILESAEQALKTVKPVKSESGSSKPTRIVKFVSAQIGDDPFGEAPPAGADAPAGADDPISTENPFGDDAARALPPQALPPAPMPAETIRPSDFNSFGTAGDTFSELSNASDLLAEDEGLRRVAAQQLEALVKSELGFARNSRDPGGSKIALKALQDQIRRAPELDPASRARLEAQVSNAIQAAARAEAIQRETIARNEAVQASQSASRRLLAEAERRNETIKQLVARYNSLIDQQLWTAANNEIAPQITSIDRGSTIDIVTNTMSNIAANEQLIRDVISKRQRGLVDTMYLNEVALIPFVDEPPVRYPPADVWQALSARRLERYGSIDLSGGNPAERAIFRSLREKSEINFNQKPLSAVIKFFADQYAIPIVIDDRALQEENISPDEPITLELPPVSFRSALKLILEPLELTYVIEDEVMRITTKKTSANVVRVYPVGDLVVPIIQMGGMGGMGGGMGGMGGGMGGMGGGMGGMGGGMGGMGGGMGGMGGGMGGMMDVKDEPAKKAKEASGTELVDQLVNAQSAERLLAELNLSKWVVSKMDLAKKAAAANNDKEVRKNFEEVIGVVSDAMRKTLPAPWMYQALSTAMEGCEYPASEIQRVLLSSIDFGADVEAAIKIGKYLSNQGMKREALTVLKDANHVNPMLKEPLELGLQLSLELQDEEAIRWACNGILSQAWTDDHLPLIEKALLAAKASMKRMNQSKETMKAYAFQEELKQSQLRDIVVRAVWTGDADIDISVEEPTGTVCDKNNARTLSGGLLLSDGSSLDKPAKDGFSETYVCANGYAGQYRILVRRVWGEVAGGTVTLNIMTDYGTKEQRVIRQQVPIRNDAIVTAEVKTGHRKEPIVDAQLAKVQTRRQAASNAVLAQAAPAAEAGGQSNYPSYYQQLLAAYASGQRSGATGGRTLPFPRPGVVGYRPIITVIPAGTQSSAFGVISGDRRYVRVTPSPLFTDIVAVDTFNTFTGGTGSGGGGGLGGGLGGGGGGGGFGGGGAF